jgi:hypothetical protein
MKNTHFRTNYTKKINIPKYVYIVLDILIKFTFLRKLKMFQFYYYVFNLPKNGKVLDI